MTNEINLEHYKELLLAEQERLEKDLVSVGRVNPDNPQDWEATPGDINDRSADPNKLADNVEEYEARTATLKELEDSLKDVRDALEKIEKGTYGICEISGEQIEEDRLEANPSARTSKSHINE
jgi:RNA polymerase-binding transcription factor DksA